MRSDTSELEPNPRWPSSFAAVRKAIVDVEAGSFHVVCLTSQGEIPEVSPIDQSRPFEQRLSDFGPELGAFLKRVWQNRAQINLRDFDSGVDAIYDLYSPDIFSESGDRRRHPRPKGKGGKKRADKHAHA